jgi:hypothetical protein
LTHCSLLLTAILHDHSLPPLCLLDPREKVVDAGDPRNAVLATLTKHQQQLHRLSDEHQGCTTCAEAATAFTLPPPFTSTSLANPASPIPSTSQDSLPSSGSRADILSSAPISNQGLYNQCQELLNRLQSLKNAGDDSETQNVKDTPDTNQSEVLETAVAQQHPPTAAEKEDSPEPVRGKGKGKGKTSVKRTHALTVEAGADGASAEDTETIGRSRKRRKR